ncbi:hypothetical protein BDQ12DRAFT_674605 [Crucibulum laeve]|uniref:CUE domain-containing protein n=1 Tax=Crucibulum laeve TaxID=68775 RepID=A0A5C3MCW4_9AGAR|nr:hypothetical protein BDQ12DRAFT_674605 [Crucibulum laeve]
MPDTNSGTLSPYHFKTTPPNGDATAPTARPKLGRENTDALLSYYESSLADEGIDYTRSHSPEKAPSRGTQHKRQMSSASTSSSDYSSESDVTGPSVHDTTSETSSMATRRSRVPSQGGSDRRRVAIVQMESSTSASDSSHSSALRTRRGVRSNLEGLALVAPPDAAPRTYKHLTPPPTAPLTGESKTPTDSRERDEKGHGRSASEIVPSKKRSPRDVGIVGTASQALREPKIQSYVDNKGLQPPVFQKASQSRSPSPTYSASSDQSEYGRGLLSPMSTRSVDTPMITPEIGQSKQIDVPVAAPVVVDLSSSSVLQPKKSMSATPSRKNTAPTTIMQAVTSSPFPAPGPKPYLHYQPGLHAIAGPLPPPPRLNIELDTHQPPPPRPPRVHSPPPTRVRGDLEAVKQALQLPPSVSAALANRAKSTPMTLPTSKAEIEKSNSIPSMGSTSEPTLEKPAHHREGAFPPSSSESPSESEPPKRPESPSPSKSDVLSGDDTRTELKTVAEESDSSGTDEDEDGVPAVTVIEPPPRKNSLPLEMLAEGYEKSDAWVNVSRDMSPSPEGRRTTSIDRGSRTPSPVKSAKSTDYGDTPSPPPKSFRNSLTTNLKRFSSLPRTPSLSSKSARRSSAGTQYSSRTPSPSLQLQILTPHRKIISKSPAAMYCHEVISVRNTAERCAIYTSKINELYNYDCGLADWVVDTKYRDPNAPTKRTPSAIPFTPQQRHTSRSSMISEATFPRRPDASVATDLSFRSYRDITPPTAPPPLPYPSLAMNQQRAYPPRSSSSVASGTPPSSIRSLASTPSIKAGFFASLGRKASISSGKREKPTLTTSTSSSSSTPTTRLLTKPPPSSVSSPRPINNPSVPGGPRAPPNRAQRSQTLMTTTSPFSSTAPLDRNETIGRRPSMFNVSSDHPVIDIRADPEFVRQVDKLVELVPHADRDVLAGYLRRAGQDVLAIGQYLEDEKNGAVKVPE